MPPSPWPFPHPLTAGGSILVSMDLDPAMDVDMSKLEGESLIEEAILRYLREVYEDPAIITGWVIVAEFVDSKGNPDLHAFACTGMPYWKINGMLEAAPNEIAYSDEDDDDDE